jgi:hypothetical protein
LAREQLGITDKVFQKHYNQPALEDRLQHHDLLMGDEETPPQQQACIGTLRLVARSLLSRP